jgi:hypothetical protein
MSVIEYFGVIFTHIHRTAQISKKNYHTPPHFIMRGGCLLYYLYIVGCEYKHHHKLYSMYHLKNSMHMEK